MSFIPWFVLFFITIVFVMISLKMRARDRAVEESVRPDLDQAVLDQLAKAGSDLSKPHAVEFFLYLPTKEAADKTADEIRGRGFEVEVSPAETGSNWLCLVTKVMVPHHPTLTGIRLRFTKMTESLGGEYDGWGTPVEREQS